MSSCSCFLFSPPLVSFPSLVFLSLHHLCYFVISSFLFCFFACISCDRSCCCGSCHYSSSFSTCVFSSPQPPARIWTGKQWTKKQIILFAYRGSLRKCPFTESLFFFSVVDFFHPQNMFLFHVLGLSFEGVRDSFVASSLFLLCLVFGTQPSFGPTCLLCLHSLDSLSSLFELFLFCVFACLFFLLWVLVCFLSILVVILGLSFLDCSVLMLFLLLNVLSARFCVGGFLGWLLRGTITESRMDVSNREGSIYFSGFL